MLSPETKILLTNYVKRNSRVINIEWDPNLYEKLRFDPFERTPEAQKYAAHYFLLAASINESMLIGRAENSRALLIHLHGMLEEKLFTEIDPENLRDIIQTSVYYDDFGSEKTVIPEILASDNRYVHSVGGDIPRYAHEYSEPQELVESISAKVLRMGDTHVEKSWMYLCWCTHPYPNLGIFSNFSPEDLQLPLTSYTRDVVKCLGLCPQETDWWQDLKTREKVRVEYTNLGRELFPDDPAKIDYPFYLLGRWIRGKTLSLHLVLDYIAFFDELHEKTGTVPVSYDIVSRQMSTFEEQVRIELEKTKIMYFYESHRFNLPGGITYRPDFVLPNCKIKRKTVLLEPHGIWGSPETRLVKIGNKTMKVQAYGTTPDGDEVRFTYKTKLFRETFGNDYHLILIVPARVKERVESWYKDSYDEVYEGTDIPDLLYKLREAQQSYP